MTPFEFCRDLRHQSPCAIVCCCLCDPTRLAVSEEHRLGTDRQTDTHDGIYRASMASRGKNWKAR